MELQEDVIFLFSRGGWAIGLFYLWVSPEVTITSLPNWAAIRQGTIFTLTNLGCTRAERKGISNGTRNHTGNQPLPPPLSLEMAQSHLGRVEAAASEERCVWTLQRLDVTTEMPRGRAGCNQSASAKPRVEDQPCNNKGGLQTSSEWLDRAAWEKSCAAFPRCLDASN